MANDILKAQVEVNSFETMSIPQDELERLIKLKLAEQFKEYVTKSMDITKQYNPQSDSTTYVATINDNLDKIEELRVVEFTKNGKVTRVELQRKSSHGWKKIPRIQIEE